MRLIVWDVDGTLVDSQAQIVAAMTEGFAAAGLAPLSRATVLSIVGLSLPVAIARLLPDADDATIATVADGYRGAFQAGRLRAEAPLFPGARDALARLGARDDVLMAVATGKSRRGLDAMIRAHELDGLFVALECADGHPSKPAPEMLLACCERAGVAPAQAVMVGDTSFDMQMAQAAGTMALGVGWGYHPVAELVGAGAQGVAHRFDEIDGLMTELLP